MLGCDFRKIIAACKLAMSEGKRANYTVGYQVDLLDTSSLAGITCRILGRMLHLHIFLVYARITTYLATPTTKNHDRGRNGRGAIGS